MRGMNIVPTLLKYSQGVMPHTTVDIRVERNFQEFMGGRLRL